MVTESIGFMEKTAVKISTTEYESLIRESEHLRILKDYVKNTDYVMENVIRSILGIPNVPKGCEQNAETRI